MDDYFDGEVGGGSPGVFIWWGGRGWGLDGYARHAIVVKGLQGFDGGEGRFDEVFADVGVHATEVCAGDRGFENVDTGVEDRGVESAVVEYGGMRRGHGSGGGSSAAELGG